jgi:hypothetical protein
MAKLAYLRPGHKSLPGAATSPARRGHKSYPARPQGATQRGHKRYPARPQTLRGACLSETSSTLYNNGHEMAKHAYMCFPHLAPRRYTARPPALPGAATSAARRRPFGDLVDSMSACPRSSMPAAVARPLADARGGGCGTVRRAKSSKQD